jgi:hypothetical protein
MPNRRDLEPKITRTEGSIRRSDKILTIPFPPGRWRYRRAGPRFPPQIFAPFGLTNRTKMFHVKHFGTIGEAEYSRASYIGGRQTSKIARKLGTLCGCMVRLCAVAKDGIVAQGRDGFQGHGASALDGPCVVRFELMAPTGRTIASSLGKMHGGRCRPPRFGA